MKAECSTTGAFASGRIDSSSLALWAKRNLLMSAEDWPRATKLSFAMAGGTLSWSGLPLARLPAFDNAAHAPAVQEACGDAQTDPAADKC